jgi:hypothetical protein
VSQELDKLRSRRDRIARLERRLAAIAEDDAKNRVNDPVVSVLKGILDLMKDEAA